MQRLHATLAIASHQKSVVPDLVINHVGNTRERALVELPGERVAAIAIDPVEDIDAPLLREAEGGLRLAPAATRDIERQALAAAVLVHEVRDRAVRARQQ